MSDVSLVFKRLGTTRFGWIDLKKVRAKAQILDRLQWTDEKLDAIFEGVKTNEHGYIHIKLFDQWFVSEDINQRCFVKTFIERELSGEDKGAKVDLLIEFPTAPNVRKDIVFHPGKDLGLTCSKTHQELFNGTTWEICAVGVVVWVVRNSQAGRAGVKQHWLIVSIDGEEAYCEDKLEKLAKGDEEFTVTFDARVKTQAAWSPLRTSDFNDAVIMGYGENGTIQIRLQANGEFMTVRKGQIALRKCQTGDVKWDD